MDFDRWNVTRFGADPSGKQDSTERINQAIAQSAEMGGGTIYIPAGVYLIDPDRSIILMNGTRIMGDGDGATVLHALPRAGSVFRRSYDRTKKNEYVSDIHLSHLSVVMEHPEGCSYEQIAFDFRHITRSTIEECYAGNYGRGRLKKHPEDMGGMARGYGVAFGNTSSSFISYCGGEVNSLVRSTVWGAKKAVVLDAQELCEPNGVSSAHATVVQGCDIQICESGIVQEGKYTAGCVFRDNIVQCVVKPADERMKSYFYRIEGYANQLYNSYIEDQSRQADYILQLGEASRGNMVEMGYFESDHALIEDLGVNNVVGYFELDHVSYIKQVNGVRIGAL